MKNTYLAIVAVLALVTAATLTSAALSQQVFAQTTTSETETDVEAKNKCNISGLSNSCNEEATST